MARVRSQIDLAASPEAVFALLTDLDRLPEWATIVVDSREASTRPLTLGCTFRQTVRVMGQELDTEWQVTELEPGRRLAYEASAALGGRLVMTQTITPRAAGSSVQLEADYDLPGGFLGDLLDLAVVEAKNEREAERSLQNLKELLDG
ncbi:MAG: SRPBCC family protein [Candidatus Limnocylindria bacterium]